VLQIKYASALLHNLEDGAMGHRLTHGHAVHLAGPFVVPEAELAERLTRQSPRSQIHTEAPQARHLRTPGPSALLDARVDVEVI
jgi:hypothetical protein